MRAASSRAVVGEEMIVGTIARGDRLPGLKGIDEENAVFLFDEGRDFRALASDARLSDR